MEEIDVANCLFSIHFKSVFSHIHRESSQLFAARPIRRKAEGQNTQYQALLEQGISTYKIGDAVEQGNIRSATRAALEIAYRI